MSHVGFGQTSHDVLSGLPQHLVHSCVYSAPHTIPFLHTDICEIPSYSLVVSFVSLTQAHVPSGLVNGCWAVLPAAYHFRLPLGTHRPLPSPPRRYSSRGRTASYCLQVFQVYTHQNAVCCGKSRVIWCLWGNEFYGRDRRNVERGACAAARARAWWDSAAPHSRHPQEASPSTGI